MKWDVTIKQLRVHQSWTQQQLAVKLGVSIPSINRWERGKSEPSQMARKLIVDLLIERDLYRCLGCGKVVGAEGKTAVQFTDGQVPVDGADVRNVICEVCLADGAKGLESVANEWAKQNA